VLFKSPLIARDVLVIVVWLTTVADVAGKDESVETCNPYEVAPVEAFQVNVGLVATPVAPFAGETRVGGAGVATIPCTELWTTPAALMSLLPPGLWTQSPGPKFCISQFTIDPYMRQFGSAQ
jgi:hypothetical protein